MLSVIIRTEGVEQPAVATLAALVPGASYRGKLVTAGIGKAAYRGGA